MLTEKSTFMKLSMSCIMIIALAISSCAQQQKKEEKTTSKIVMQKVKMPVDGMTCSACQSNVKKTIKSIDGVSDVEVSLEKRFAYFTYDPKKVKVENVQKAVNNKGYTAGKPQEVKQ